LDLRTREATPATLMEDWDLGLAELVKKSGWNIKIAHLVERGAVGNRQPGPKASHESDTSIVTEEETNDEWTPAKRADECRSN